MNIENMHPQQVLSIALQEVRNKNFERALEYLDIGSKKYPYFKDNYGHDAFKKEIVRTLLALKKYREAFATAVSYGFNFGEHGVLFARAFLMDGNIEAARAWWLIVLNSNASNSECNNFFKIYPPFPQNVINKSPEVLNQLNDIVKEFPGVVFECVFDVGANTGEFAKNFLNFSKSVKLHCFEPSPASFKELENKFGGEKHIYLSNFAFSNCCGEKYFLNKGTSTMNRINEDAIDGIKIKTITIDEYCKEKSIDGIDYLKIDTEGHEMKILEGAVKILEAVKFIDLEVSMNPYNKYHASYLDVATFLYNHGFYLFGIYEQVKEWSGGGLPILRRSNPLFVNKSLIGSIPTDVITY